MDKEREERLDYYANLAKGKGYRQETIEMGFMISMSTTLIEKYGDKKNSLEEVIKICEKHDDGEKFIAEVGDLLGIE